MQFKVGDKAVYPAHGVGVIRAIEEQEFDGLDPQTFYVLKILDNGMTIMVPIDNADAIEVGKVLRDLALMKMEKNLSFGERKMFDQAQRLLVEEIAVAKDTDEAAIKAEIESIFVNDAPEEDPKAKKGKGKKKK